MNANTHYNQPWECPLSQDEILALAKIPLVYFATTDDLPGILKIGETSNLQRRMKDLTRVTPVNANLVVPTSSKEASRKLETSLHKEFEKYRINDTKEYFSDAIRPLIPDALNRLGAKVTISSKNPRDSGYGPHYYSRLRLIGNKLGFLGMGKRAPYGAMLSLVRRRYGWNRRELRFKYRFPHDDHNRLWRSCDDTAYYLSEVYDCRYLGFSRQAKPAIMRPIASDDDDKYGLQVDVFCEKYGLGCGVLNEDYHCWNPGKTISLLYWTPFAGIPQGMISSVIAKARESTWLSYQRWSVN